MRLASSLRYGGGPRRLLDVYAPRKLPSIPSPVVLFFYGGSWNSGSRLDYPFVGRALAANGFLAVIPDYRIVPEVAYPSFVEDGAEAVAWIQSNIGEMGGDPSRIVLMGHSAGASIAAMLSVDRQWLGRRREAVKGLVGLAGPYDFAPLDYEVSRAAFGGWQRIEETQPVHWAGAGDPPALLLTGATDRTISPRNSAALRERLVGAGVSAEWLSYPGIGHIGILLALARPLRGRASVLADAVRFARSVTQG